MTFQRSTCFCWTLSVSEPKMFLLKMASFRSQDDNTRGCYSESYLSGCKVILRAMMILRLMAIQCHLFQADGEDPTNPWTYYEGKCMKSEEFCQSFETFSYTTVSITWWRLRQRKSRCQSKSLKRHLVAQFQTLDFRASCAKAARGLWRHSASFQSGSVLPRISTTGRNFTHSCLWPLDTLESR